MYYVYLLSIELIHVRIYILNYLYIYHAVFFVYTPQKYRANIFYIPDVNLHYFSEFGFALFHLITHF